MKLVCDINIMVTLRQYLYPISFMCFITGLGFYPKKQLQIRSIALLNILYFFIFLSVHTCLFLYVTTSFTRSTLFDSIAMEICEKFNFLLSVISIIMSFYHQKTFEISIKKLTVIDDTLEKLGSPQAYKKLHIKLKQMIFGWIIYSITINVFDSVWWLNFEGNVFWEIYTLYIINYSDHINTFVEMLFIFFLWYIGTRFDEINKHMRCILTKEKFKLKNTWKKCTVYRYTVSTHYEHTQILWTLKHLHLELSRLTHELNFIFTIQITLEIKSYLLYLTSLFYYLYIMLVEKRQENIYTRYDHLNTMLWTFIFLMKLYFINYICENVTIKANQISKLFYQLTYTHQYNKIWKEAYQFTLQTMLYRLKFTGMGLFYLGYECFGKCCTTILMYVIIMVQFKMFIY